MEDEDLEGRIMDAWRISGDQEVSRNDETLKRTSKVLTDSSKATKISYNDVKIEDTKEDKCNSDVSDDSPIKNATIDSTSAKIAFKGFKKRILAQTQENQISTLRPNHRENHRASSKKIREKRTTIEGKRGKITEYAQYLGLQPASNKTNCTNCETINLSSQSMIKEHQCTCPSETMTQSTGRASPGTSDSLTTTTTATTTLAPAATTTNSLTANSANNFRITRKVYLCAACGTYFENWNLFLHMREIHKRHICLFCLGMFGQAERLSCHLTKKHSVPETEFTSVGDFYNVFKGSCYLICCTCEKVFSETDNFYNHFCSPVQKEHENSTSEICSLCRQTTNNHASTCSLVQPENHDCGQSNQIEVPSIPEISDKPVEEKTPVRGTNKRILKNNRIKRNEESALMLYQQKVEELQARKMSIKSSREQKEPREESSPENIISETPTVPTLETATTTTTTSTIINTMENDSSSLNRDTVSETIMEVSQCMDDSRLKEAKFQDSSDLIEVNNSIIKISSSPSHSISSSSLASPVRHHEMTSCYDSVTETIMQVSRGLNDNEAETSDDDDDDDYDNNHRFIKNETSSRGSDADALIMDDAALTGNDEESANGKEHYDDRLKNSLNRPKNERRRKRRRAIRRKGDVETLENSDSDEMASSSNEEKNDRTRERSISESCSSPEKESQRSVSFTTVNSTDRSLVIKICTNRNAQFTITRSTNSTSENCNENHETSRESEENNNGEDSASDGKLSNLSERGDGDSVNSCHEDDDDDDDDDRSDQESIKLAIDAKPEGEPANDGIQESTTIDETREDFHVDVEEHDEKETFAETIKLENEENKEVEKSTIDNETMENSPDPEKSKNEEYDGIVLAPEDVPSMDLNVEGILENIKIEDLLKRCINAASSLCVYCNHARHIAVNGKQLGLHVLAEHRFQPQHPAIIIQREQFIVILKKSLNEVENIFFNLDSFDSNNGTYHIAEPRIFECFHCRYHSLVHKEIYLHNRKMHQKTILICIMCKSTFYSYSELLCHLCPGVYSPNTNVTYRCCLCPLSNLPSAFRLMVHLRKRHHSCDVCLESTGNQQRLSNHVWKHKLHHLCYRCGIAYRNKPDITKHLFWKHGTESVLCKKCLQKKWPHVYHFCIPPTTFVCEECTSTFSRAVALKVHKRLHSGDRPYGCGECEERFISRRLMVKHEASHREPEIIIPEIVTPEIPLEEEKMRLENAAVETATIAETTMETKEIETLQAETESEKMESPIETKEAKEPVKKVVDVYDLPPLNLSSDSDSDAEETPMTEVAKKEPLEVKTANEEATAKVGTSEDQEISVLAEKNSIPTEQRENVLDVELDEEEKKEEAQIMDGIWDNFKSYAASLGQDSTTIELTSEEKKKNEIECEFLRKLILADHDYCVVYPDKSGEETKEEVAKIEDTSGTMGGEHDYGHKVTKSPSTGSAVLNCDSDTNTATKRKKEKTPKKKRRNDGSTSSSDSSSDSDSSSCSCGTNCSCSSSTSGSSSSSSSSSDSDSSASESSPRKQTVRKERRRDKEKESTTTEDKKNSIKPEVDEKIEPSTTQEENECNDMASQNETVDPNVEICQRPPSPQLIFQESDLDTDETETDEDFYDEHPQQLANRLLAEKRNQLMLLAAVAPAVTEMTPISGTLNNLNGTLENETTNTNSLEASTPMNINLANRPNSTPVATTRKRVKTKKRKKSDRGKQSKNATSATTVIPTTTPTVESIKLNIPKSFYQKRNNKKSLITVMPSRSSTPSIINSSLQSEVTPQKFINDAIKTSMSGAISGGSISENDNKRSSKRKRVPKRFYGDSSDEEHQQQQQQQLQLNYQNYNQPSMKWRKVETAPSVVPPISIKTPTPPVAIPANYGTKSVTLRLSGFDQPLERIVPMITAASATESEEQAESSSADSSETEEANVPQTQPQIQPPPIQQQPTIVGPSVVPNTPNIPATNSGIGPERSVNLYCYCQCPYDEVSEMIACDGNDCHIEWFHFECVGIMVPPKGKWYCPDCRRKDSSLTNDDCLE